MMVAFLMLACSGEKQPETGAIATDTAQVLHAPSRPTTQPQQASESAGQPSQTGTSQSLVGTWSFALGQRQMVVTYKSDGTFDSESTMGGARLELHGTYDFDGNTLVSHPLEFSTSDTVDAKAAEVVKQLNDRIKQNPKAVTEEVTVKFKGNGKFTASNNQGQSVTFTRMQ